jgi:cyclopropane-fatty-acyl-phospholipid synthase
MTAVTAGIGLVERVPWPDVVTRAGIAYLVGRTRHRLADGGTDVDRRFAVEMAHYPIATHVADANKQHYEVPADLFDLMLGPRRKYSCCYYDQDATSLAAAEIRALELTAAHAALANGQTILELGCGWGSLSLWLADRYPASRIVAVSNSRSQRDHIETRSAALGLRNLEVVTADMNTFVPDRTFDRIVSVEMFEHMSNWGPLLQRIRGWLRPDGRLFIHVFSHRQTPYRFSPDDPSDWIAQHFFSGGIMPSHGLIRQFGETFTVESEWSWNGTHYLRTARDWLARFDANADKVRSILEGAYGRDAALWHRRWRLFLLATMGLFGHHGGREWGVSHYRLRPADALPIEAGRTIPS